MTMNSEKYLKASLNKHIPYIKSPKFSNIKIQHLKNTTLKTIKRLLNFQQNINKIKISSLTVENIDVKFWLHQ